MAPDRRDWISLKFIWHMTSNKTQVGSKGEVTCQFGQENLSLVHDVLVLFMFTLMADSTRVGSKLCYRYILLRVEGWGGYLVSLVYCHFLCQSNLS